MASRMERIAKQMKDVEQSEQIMIVDWPWWGEEILYGKDPGYLTDPATVTRPSVFGNRDLTEAELKEYVERRLQARRARAADRLKLSMGTKDQPEALNDAARIIRENRKSHYRR